MQPYIMYFNDYPAITPDLKGLIIYIVCLFISSLGLGAYSTALATMGDAIDYNEWKHGAREEGVTYRYIHSSENLHRSRTCRSSCNNGGAGYEANEESDI